MCFSKHKGKNYEKLRFGVFGNMGPEADALFQDIVAKKEIEHGALKD
ncbi:hypothetical protein [Vibrio sp. 10N.222.54.B11]